MTVSLRPHHLLCILTYVGRGYNQKFTNNMAAIIERIRAGEEIAIVDGPDDICAPLISGALAGMLAHCRRKSVIERDQAAADEIGELLSIPVRRGHRFHLTGAEIKTLRQAFADNSVRTACKGCQWNALCSAVAVVRDGR